MKAHFDGVFAQRIAADWHRGGWPIPLQFASLADRVLHLVRSEANQLAKGFVSEQQGWECIMLLMPNRVFKL
ncbi:MAG: hypothetical protein ACRERE_44445 [Candidatus Entotheonellia bacterium]